MVLAFGTAPGAWDALTYHLPKAALALQNGAFYEGPVNFWAQAAHPHYGTALLVVSAIAGGSREAAWCAWQMVGYGVAAACVFRVAQHAGATPRGAAFAMLLFVLLPSAIVQAPTPLNDMLLAALTGAATVELLDFMRWGGRRRLVRFTIAIALGFGTKANFVCQALMLIVLAVAMASTSERSIWRRAAALAVAVIVGVLLASPSGYLANVRRFGNPLGPPDAVAHAASGSLREVAADGALNTLRFATDFVSLDGLPRVAPLVAAQHRLRRAVAAIMSIVPSIATPRAARTPFVLDRMMLAHEAHSYWGVEGLLLIWPAVILALGRREPVARSLALATVAYLLAQGFVSAYDSWHGRYFLSSAVLAVPLAGRVISSRRRAAGVLLAIAVPAVCVSGLATALVRSRSPLVAFRYAGEARTSILALDRAAQLTRNRPELAEAVRLYNARVPETAVVASLLTPDSFEYVLYGPRLRRRVLPVGDRDPAWAHAQGAAFLVFSDRRLTPKTGDVNLGADWWLRTLTTPSERN
jgi:hypothetical protein